MSVTKIIGDLAIGEAGTENKLTINGNPLSDLFMTIDTELPETGTEGEIKIISVPSYTATTHIEANKWYHFETPDNQVIISYPNTSFLLAFDTSSIKNIVNMPLIQGPGSNQGISLAASNANTINYQIFYQPGITSYGKWNIDVSQGVLPKSSFDFYSTDTQDDLYDFEGFFFEVKITLKLYIYKNSQWHSLETLL